MLRAREVLNDCRHVLELLETEENRQTHRVLWVAGVTLVRAVGHVLDKVDRTFSVRLSRALNAAYARWNRKDNLKDEIFVHFINEERNLVLKEYEFGYDDSDYELIAGGAKYKMPGLIFCPITDGPYAGEDGRNILRDAIGWWEVELRKLEEEL